MFTLRLLGGAALEGDREAVTGRAGHPRRLALLALVASAPRGTSSREKLIAYLWPDSDTEQGRHLLKESLYVLRRALGGDALLSEGDNVRLDPERISSDLVEFEVALERGDLERAVRLYAGPFLDGFFLKGAPEFERWVETKRRRLADAYGKALESLAEQAESASDYTVAADWWKRLAAHDPYNSRVVLRLMQALAAAGDPANALEYARVHELRVREELGIEPPEDLQAYAERLRKEPVQVSKAVGVPTPVESRVTPTEMVARPTEGARGFRRVVHEIHHRSLWQVLLVYCGGALIAYQAVQALTEGLGLPDWFPGFAIVLFIVGVPIVLATAFVYDVALPTVTRAAPTPLTEADAAGMAVNIAAARKEAGRRHRFLTWRNAVASFLVALAVWGVVATGWLLFGERAAGLDEERKSIAVLPFENIGGAAENEAFTDGIHDDILTHLYKIGDLKPIARTSVMRYRGTTMSVREIAEELGVATVLEGGVQRVGDRVRISAQLVDPETEQHLWAETYDSTLTAQNIFSIQTDIARRIARALRATLSSEEEAGIEAIPTDNLEAYDYYIRGKVEVSRDFDAGVRLLERAVEIDPEFAVAWAELATVRLYEYWRVVDIGLREPGLEALDRAVELAPDAFETHLAQAGYHNHITQDQDQALEHLRAAEKLRPNDADLLSDMGWTLMYLGRWDEALAYYQKAVEVDPLNAARARRFGNLEHRLDNLAEAERYYDRAIALDPSNPSFYNRKFSFLLEALGDTVRAREFAEQYPERAEEWLRQLDYLRRDYELALEGYLSEPMFGALSLITAQWKWLLYTYLAMNQRERLRALADSLRLELERYLGELNEKTPPTQIAYVRCLLGVQYAVLGDREAAIREVREALEIYPESRDALNYPLILDWAAKVYLLVGSHDEAIDYLKAMLSRPYYRKAAWLRIHPFYDPLRDHPRFQALLERYDH